MLRKHLRTARPVVSIPGTGAQAIAATATVWVPSEATDAPIDHVFDQRRGPGRGRWIAAEPGEQRLILVFDHPQTVGTITVEVEELEVSRTQALHVSVAPAGGQIIQALRRQEDTCSPPGTTFEHEEWAVMVQGVTPLQPVITPDNGGKPCRATLTTPASR